MCGGLLQVGRADIQQGILPSEREIEQEIDHGGQIGQGRCHACADHTEPQKPGQDKDGVQKDIQKAAQGNAKGSLGRSPFGPDQIGQQGIQNRWNAAENNDPFGVSQAEGIRFFRGAAEGQDGAGKEQKEKRKQQCRQKPQPKGNGRNFFGGGQIFFAQLTGDEAGTADAEQVGDGGQHHEGRIDDGDGCRLGRGVQHAYEIGIGQAIKKGDHLAEYGGDDLSEYGLTDGELFKNCGAAVHFHPPF